MMALSCSLVSLISDDDLEASEDSFEKMMVHLISMGVG